VAQADKEMLDVCTWNLAFDINQTVVQFLSYFSVFVGRIYGFKVNAVFVTILNIK